MTIQELQTVLHEKIAAEQGQYREWLMEQSPGEILNHAREHAIRMQKKPDKER